jgi:hypothetical protein
VLDILTPCDIFMNSELVVVDVDVVDVVDVDVNEI